MNDFDKNELWLYALAFCVAVALRFFALGALPLSEAEAKWALQALYVAQGMRPLLGPQPIYILPTALLFFLFGATDFLARFVPALTGSLLVGLPFLFRQRLKPTSGLLLAFCLALDPGLIALSRQAGSPMPALAFSLLAWAFWWRGQPRMAGVLAALALLSGPALWPGLLSLGLAWGLGELARPRAAASTDGEKPSITESGQGEVPTRRNDLQAALMAGGVVILLGGTLLFLAPNGMSAWLASLPEWLSGWGRPAGVPAGRLLLALAIYQPLAVLFGLAALWRGVWQGRRRFVRLGLWLCMALLLALMYPARQVSDLAWVLIPLWALAALESSNHVHWPQEGREALGIGLLLALFLIFAWLNYANIALDPTNPAHLTPTQIQYGGNILLGNLPPVRYLLLASLFLLLVIGMLLVSLGWSPRTARLATLWGLTMTLGLYALGMAWSATGLRTPQGWELWQDGPRPVQANLLRETVEQLSAWNGGDEQGQEVTLVGIDSPALNWLLRNHALHHASGLDPLQTPPLVVTSNQEDLSLTSAYRGQDFLWQQEPDWPNANLYKWIHWSVFHELPYTTETIILWVRADLFPDAHPSLQ
ncbi:MAG: hypothetical protein Fur0043_00470 [Anaerolineales bacterium]